MKASASERNHYLLVVNTSLNTLVRAAMMMSVRTPRDSSDTGLHGLPGGRLGPRFSRRPTVRLMLPVFKRVKVTLILCFID